MTQAMLKSFQPTPPVSGLELPKMADADVFHRHFRSELARRNRANPTLENFQSMVRMGLEQRFAEVMLITPEIATYLLDNNDGNRRKKTHRIKEIRDEILNKRWQCNGETVIVSVDGKLNDGQNRLSAIVEAGVPVEVLVAFGFDRESRMSVDSIQSPRIAGDHLHMSGVTGAKAISVVAAYLLHYERHGSFNRSQAINSREVSAYAIENLKLIESALDAVDRAAAKPLAAHALMCAIFVTISRVAGAAPTKAFFGKLLKGDDLSHKDPIFILRSRLLQESYVVRYDSDIVTELVIRGWNHSRLGTTTARMVTMGRFPEIEA